jgi:transcriptional regulator with XRE-family HTH domain
MPYQRRMPKGVMENARPQSSEQENIEWWLRQAVKISGLSPGALAKKAGISPTTLTRLIYGRATHLPSWRTLMKIAAAANIPPPAATSTSSSDVQRFDDEAEIRAKDLFHRLLTEEQRRELDRDGYVTISRGEYRYRFGPRCQTQVDVLDQSDHPIESWCAYLPDMPLFHTYTAHLLMIRSDPAKLREVANVIPIATRSVAESTFSSDVADEETKQTTLPVQHTIEAFFILSDLVHALAEADPVIMAAADAHGPDFKAACAKIDKVGRVLWKTLRELAMAMKSVEYPFSRLDDPSRREQTVAEADTALEPQRRRRRSVDRPRRRN